MVLSQSMGSSGRLGSHLEFTPIRDCRGHEPLSVRVLVDQLNVRSKEPLHLIPEPQLGISARLIDLQLSHEVAQGPPQWQHSVLRMHRSGAYPGNQ